MTTTIDLIVTLVIVLLFIAAVPLIIVGGFFYGVGLGLYRAWWRFTYE